MAKTEVINLRLSKEDKEMISRLAEESGMNITEYICDCIYLRDETKVILKTDFAAELCDIAAYLDCAEVKDRRTVREFRRRVKKLWKLL